MRIALPLLLTLAITPQAQQPVSTTPTGCLKEVRDYVAKRQAELGPIPPVASPGDTAAAQARAKWIQLSQAVTADRLSMNKACAANFCSR